MSRPRCKKCKTRRTQLALAMTFVGVPGEPAAQHDPALDRSVRRCLKCGRILS